MIDVSNDLTPNRYTAKLPSVSLHSPVTQPKLKYMNQMLGAQMLIMKPNEAINVPAIDTIRHPNLFVSALAIGPTHT